ncbi:MAG: hypothetical protein QXQ53_01225 [Candidatus Methanosuratincola sp.]
MIERNWAVIESDPDFQSLPPHRQNAWREAWIEEMVRQTGKTKPDELAKAREQFRAIAYATVPQTHLPPHLTIPTKIPTTASEVAGHVWRGFWRGLGLPQQLVATTLASPRLIKEKGAAEPFRRIYNYLATGERVELPGGLTTELLTDPFSWAGIGAGVGAFATRFAGKSIPDLIAMASRNPRLRPLIHRYLSELTHGRLGPLESAFRVSPSPGLAEVGVGALSPEQQHIIATITKNPKFKRLIRSPKRLVEFAETYARSSPEERKVLLSTLRDPVKRLDLFEWLETLPSRRPPLTPSSPPHKPPSPPPTPTKATKATKTTKRPSQRKRPLKESQTVVEELNEPTTVSQYFDEFLSRTGD